MKSKEGAESAERCLSSKHSTASTAARNAVMWLTHVRREQKPEADAIMDRLTANARRIELKGESLRRKSK